MDIDHTLKKHIPSFSIKPPLGFPKASAKPITIRTLLTHHSGLPGDLQNGGFTRKPRPDYNKFTSGGAATGLRVSPEAPENPLTVLRTSLSTHPHSLEMPDAEKGFRPSGLHRMKGRPVAARRA